MGGNAIKSAKRISKENYELYWNELRSLFPELIMERIKAYRQKIDFGDMDIVIKIIPNVNIKQMVFDRLGKNLEHYDNNMFFSFLYKDAQVDFIFMSEEDYDVSLSYFSWNDLGNFFGRVARSLNFKYGHDGLSYDLHLDDHYKISISISKDTDKILEFLGYDGIRYNQGFDTEEEIFEFAASSTYFNALYFTLEDQSHNDRVRNKKRKMYQKMLQYIIDHSIKPLPKLAQEEREIHIHRASKLFGIDLITLVNTEKEKYAEYVKFKTLFNGDIVKELTQLNGKELGKFMTNIREKYPNLKNDVLANDGTYVVNLINTEFGKFNE